MHVSFAFCFHSQKAFILNLLTFSLAGGCLIPLLHFELLAVPAHLQDGNTFQQSDVGDHGSVDVHHHQLARQRTEKHLPQTT